MRWITDRTSLTTGELCSYDTSNLVNFEGRQDGPVGAAKREDIKRGCRSPRTLLYSTSSTMEGGLLSGGSRRPDRPSQHRQKEEGGKGKEKNGVIPALLSDLGHPGA